MANLIFTNNASALLATSIIPTDTVIEVASGFGARFPAPSPGTTWFYIILEDNAGNFEVCRCTSRTGDLLTVVRGQDNTTAQSFTLNVTRVELRTTAVVVEEFVQKNGDVMTGDLDFNGNDVVDAVLSGPLTAITAGSIQGVPLRGADNGTGNEIVVPSANGAPTIGGVAILKSGDDIVAQLDTAGVIILNSATVGVRIPDNGYLRVEGADQNDYFSVAHDDTDVNIVCAGTQDLNIFSLLGNVVLGAGIGLHLTPSGSTNYNLKSPNILDFSYESQTYAAATTVNIDYELGSYVTINLSATQLTNLNITNVPSKFAAVRLKIVQDATGGRTITNWPGTTRWPNGLAPVLSGMAANAYMFVDLWTDDGGTTWNGGYSALTWS